MDGQISFLEKFKKYSPKEEYRKILEKVSDYRIRTDKERKMIETFASFPEIVEKEFFTILRAKYARHIRLIR